MKTIAITLLAMLLTGCTITPGEVRARAPIYETRIAAEPDVAAACIAEFLDEVRSPTTHRVVLHRDRGSAEVIGSSSMATFSVINLQEESGTTRVSVRRPPSLAPNDDDYSKAVASCSATTTPPPP